MGHQCNKVLISICLIPRMHSGCSVRIGRDTEREGKGYFEDRRPASNMDPYLVTGMIFKSMAGVKAPLPVL